MARFRVDVAEKRASEVKDTQIEIAKELEGTLRGVDELEAKFAELTGLDTEIREKLLPFKGSRFCVFHPSFGYFAEAYGLTQIPVELDGKSPSPRQLVALIEQAKGDGVKVVFVQKQFPAESARAIADAIGGTVAQLDPLAEDSVANLRLITESIVQALGK